MADRDYEQLMARYLAGREELAREEISKAAPLISRFTDLAALEGVSLPNLRAWRRSCWVRCV